MIQVKISKPEPVTMVFCPDNVLVLFAVIPTSSGSITGYGADGEETRGQYPFYTAYTCLQLDLRFTAALEYECGCSQLGRQLRISEN